MTLRERCEKAAQMELERQELTDYDMSRWADVIEREAKAFAEKSIEQFRERALSGICSCCNSNGHVEDLSAVEAIAASERGEK